MVLLPFLLYVPRSRAVNHAVLRAVERFSAAESSAGGAEADRREGEADQLEVPLLMTGHEAVDWAELNQERLIGLRWMKRTTQTTDV